MSLKLQLESLDDRLVPATLYDLTAAGASATLPSGAIVQQTDAQPTGTGVIQSFVRVQGAANGGGSEQGYNTDARPLQFNENKSPVFTRSLQVGDVPVITVGGVAYREFLLDVNQKASASKISLDEVRVYTCGQPKLTEYNAITKTLAGMATRFDLDANGDVAVILDARLNSGSGSGDMFLLVPNTAFAGTAPTDYIYLYSKFGVQAGATANGGFEEWAVRETDGGTTTPEGTASISGRVFLDLDTNGVFDTNSGDAPLVGVTIQLSGVNDLGQTVTLTTTTNADGTYSFTNLRAGTYTIAEVVLPPEYAGLQDGDDYIGTINGSSNGEVGAEQFYGIVIADGEHGLEYNFTERWE